MTDLTYLNIEFYATYILSFVVKISGELFNISGIIINNL